MNIHSFVKDQVVDDEWSRIRSNNINIALTPYPSIRRQLPVSVTADRGTEPTQAGSSSRTAMLHHESFNLNLLQILEEAIAICEEVMKEDQEE